ncbi:hypothetical protein XENOCAPTIV_031041, partial [Xenoophorus captivus]
DTEEEHLERLQTVVERITAAGLKLNLKKCQFGQFQVGSLEGLYTLRDSRGRPDRIAFEGRLVTAAGVLWVQRQRSHYRDKRVPLMGLHYDLTKSKFGLIKI